jgi:hypothetical protein
MTRALLALLLLLVGLCIVGTMDYHDARALEQLQREQRTTGLIPL